MSNCGDNSDTFKFSMRVCPGDEASGRESPVPGTAGNLQGDESPPPAPLAGEGRGRPGQRVGVDTQGNLIYTEGDRSPSVMFRTPCPTYAPLGPGLTDYDVGARGIGRPPAVVLPPAGAELVTGQLDRDGKHVSIRPEVYDGRNYPWPDYLQYFLTLAELYEWNDLQKARYLTLNLRDSAQQCAFSELSGEERRDFGLLSQVLQRRFHSSSQRDVHKVNLRTRLRRKDETLAELHDWTHQTARLAYPNGDASLRGELATESFVSALGDRDMRLHVMCKNPKSLAEALDLAERYEAAQRAEEFRDLTRAPRRSVRAVQAATPDATGPVGSDMRALIAGLRREIDELKRDRQRGFPERQRVHPSRGACWSCGDVSHFQRDCPRRGRDDGPRRGLALPRGPTNVHARDPARQGN